MSGRPPLGRARRAATLRAIAVGVATTLVAARGAWAQDVTCDPGDIEVRRLQFVGNRTFSDALLLNGIETTPSSWARRVLHVVGTRHCLDSLSLRRDSLRLVVFYRRHGFPQVGVGTQVDSLAPRVIGITFRIREGAPLVTDSFTVRGLDSIPSRARLVRDLPLRVGARFDLYDVSTARDTLAQRLRDSGYPFADVLLNYATDTVRRRAEVEFNVVPGPRARLGAIRVRDEPRPGGRPEVTAAAIRRLTALAPGDLYRERNLNAAKRKLYLTDAFRHVDVVGDSASLAASGDSTMDVTVSVSEGFLHAPRVSAGYGTLDCFRTSGQYTDLNFLKGLRRFELDARVSKIGIGTPLDFARGFCSNGILGTGLRGDPYSDTLNYYAGATLRQATLFGRLLAPSLTVYSERRSEYKAFLRTTPVGAVASVSRQTQPRVPLTVAYQLEYGRTEAQPALFCALFDVCDPADRAALRASKRAAALSLSISRNRADNALYPTEGTVARLELRHASPLVGSDHDNSFNKAIGDASLYHTLSPGTVFAARLRVGEVVGVSRQSRTGTASFVPPQERLFAGGPNSVRGFRQNELGPLIYVIQEPQGSTERIDTVPVGPDTVFEAQPGTTRFRVVPAGGTSVVVANAELRIRSPFLPELVQWTTFVDVGEVWNRQSEATHLGFRRLKWTPGVGVRVVSPVGPVGVDVGYNPYGRPAGPAYYSPAALQGNAPLYCVSPGNKLKVTGTSTASGAPPAEQAAGACPSSYQPPRSTGLLSRLTLQFSIGQAF